MTAGKWAPAFAAWWADTYTRGLPASIAQERRAELASDLWEQRAHGAPALALSILRRTLTGIPADLSWRYAQTATLRSAGTRQCRACGKHYERRLRSCPVCTAPRRYRVPKPPSRGILVRPDLPADFVHWGPGS